MRDFSYPHLYMEEIEDPPHASRKRFGWCTSNKSRPVIIDWLKYLVNIGQSGIRCVQTFDEMLNFKRQDDGKEEADEGTFDDRVMDAAIGKHCIKTLSPVIVMQPQKAGSPNVQVIPGRSPEDARPPDPKAFS